MAGHDGVTMRYPEPKQQSAEWLRAALTKMGQHDAAFNPLTFAVWYEVVAGTNRRLEVALREALTSDPRLGDATMQRLHEEYIQRVDDVELARLSTEFQRVMETVAQSADLTGRRAGLFGRQLDGLSDALQRDDLAGSEAVPPGLSPWLSDTITGVADMKSAAGELQRQVATSQQEIDRLRDDLSRAREEALIDPMTGILNRGGFDRQLAELLRQPPDGGTAHCLVMLDIDHFKKVNDTHGHVVGDRVIAAVGEVLRKSAADGGHRVARYGGEEFAILLPHSSIDRAAQLAEAVRNRTRAMRLRNRSTQEVLLTVTVSAGVAAMRSGDAASGLIARADAALYQSKQSGRDRVTRG